MRLSNLFVLILGIQILSWNHLPAQAQIKKDSLLYLFEKSNIDTQKVKHALALSEEYWENDSIKSVHYIKAALSISQKLRDKKWLNQSLIKQVRYYWKKGKLGKAKEVLVEVKKNLAIAGYKLHEAAYYQYLGLIEHEEGNYEVAARHFVKALDLYEKLEDEEGIAQCYNNMGSVYWQLEELEKAKENFEKYAQIREKNGDLFAVAATYGNVGLIYRAKDDFDKALDYYHRSLKIFRQLDKKFNVGINLQNIGSLYHKQDKFSIARKYFEETLALCREIDDNIGELYALHSIATVDIKESKYQEGIKGLKQALKMAKELKVKEEIKNIYGSLAEAYAKAGIYKQAYEYQEIHETWKDSLIGEKHLKQVQELEIAYETEKKDKQILQLNTEKEIQLLEAKRQDTWNKSLLAGLLLMAIIGVLLFYTFRQRLRNEKILAKKDIELKENHFQQKLLNSEMTALRAQMNPHFIFNCLNSINRMILSGEDENASRYLTKFSKLLRMILENAEKSTVSLEDEMLTLNSYIELESLRFKEKIQVKLHIDPDIDPETTFIPSMLLQPLIENAIWHGLLPKEQEGLLSISMQAKEDILECKIEDNGVGRERSQAFKEKSSLKSRSLGLEITQERLKLLNKQVTKQLFKITDLKDSFNKAIGTRVEIALPIS